ncbi:LolA-like protein [Pelobacter propionicus]|uniref:Lipoprotein, putative n=1 Tax=Pelobacter propionicus (strain DSM 2379 / NBRC 103807 / OttBd1) TaxID=338966 RepID=A1AML4_PELPD|nr:lipoprotein insertase outer membrane protein LolB [Pelobacter propionicus]ABK98584.1 lipoprotein, putative [Pelobacter propionicus DSM 2379]
MNLLRVVTCLLFLFISACATVQKPPLVPVPGSSVDTLSSSVSLSLRTAGGTVSGNGLMTYRRPDQFHFVMLSPFGSTVLEAFALGDRLTLVYPSQAVAYSGRFEELPQGSGMAGWRLLRWVMDTAPSVMAGMSGTIQRSNSVVGSESVTFASGLVTHKTAPTGDRVSYGAYEMVNGVPFAGKLEMLTMDNDRILLGFQEPEVNLALDLSDFTPRLKGVKILPLSALPVAAPGE